MITAFYLKGFVSNGVQLGWASSNSSASFILESSASESGPWSFIKAVSGDLDWAVVTKDELHEENHKVLRLTEYSVNSTISDTKTLIVDLDRISAGPLTTVAVDSNGIPRLLKTDAGGNLLVSYMGGEASGYGDASEGLQIQQLSAINNVLSSANAIKAAVDAVTAKLSDARLNATQISDLKNVSVSNIPTDFPDHTAQTILTSIHASMAKDASMATAISLLAQLLKKTDLDLSASGEVSTLVNNLPTDFPDAAASSKLSDIDAKLYAVFNAISALQPILESTDVSTSSILNSSVNSSELLSNITALLTAIQNTSDQLLTTSVSMKDTSEDSQALLSGVFNNTSNLLKKEDIPVNEAGDIKAEVLNIPAIFPDPDVLAEIAALRADAAAHTSGLVSVISAPIPEGSNKIGVVSLDNAILPEDAAKDSTLSDINSRISYLISQFVSSAPGTHKALLISICNKLDAIKSSIEASYDSVKLYETVEYNTIAANSVLVTEVITNATSGKLLLAAASNSPLGMLVTVTTSADGIKYWPLSGFTRIEVVGNRLHLISVPSTLKYIKIEISNPSTYSSINGVYLRVDRVL